MSQPTWRAVAARAASLLLRYPDDEVLAAPAHRARRARRPAGRGRRAAARRWSPTGRAPTRPARRRVRAAVRLPAPLLPAPDLLHRRRHPQARRGAGRLRRRRTRRPGWPVVDGELPDFLPAVLDLAARRRRRLAAAAGEPGRPRPARRGAGAGEVGRTGTRSRPSGRCCRPPDPATSPPPPGWPAPDHRWSRSAWNRSDSSTPPEAVDEHAAVGGVPVPGHGGAGRRADLALPLRQVRLDHPLLAALRERRAALGQPAVPLRRADGPGRTHRRPAGPEVLDRGGRRHRAHLPPDGRVHRHGRRPVHPDRPGHPDRPPPADRAGLRRHHPQRQGHVRGARRGDRAGPAGHRAGQRRSATATTTGRPSPRGSGRCSTSARTRS